MNKHKRQGGVMMLEVLIAILIFSIGILAVVGMQGVAISSVTDARNRSEASFLASELLAQIWSDAANASSYAYAGSGGVPAKLTTWKARVDARMPGATTVPPIITVANDATLGMVITVSVRWQMPNDTTTRKHDMVATVNVNP